MLRLIPLRNRILRIPLLLRLVRSLRIAPRFIFPFRWSPRISSPIRWYLRWFLRPWCFPLITIPVGLRSLVRVWIMAIGKIPSSSLIYNVDLFLNWRCSFLRIIDGIQKLTLISGVTCHKLEKYQFFQLFPKVTPLANVCFDT